MLIFIDSRFDFSLFFFRAWVFEEEITVIVSFSWFYPGSNWDITVISRSTDADFCYVNFM